MFIHARLASSSPLFTMPPFLVHACLCTSPKTRFALDSVSLGRLKLREEAGEDEKEEGLGDIKFGAQYYKETEDTKGFTLYSEMAKIYETRGGCVDYDVVECLENAVECAVLCWGECHPTTVKALKLLGEKCDEGGDFERSKKAFKRALRGAKSLYGEHDPRIGKIRRRMETVGEEEEVAVDVEELEDPFLAEKSAAAEFLKQEKVREAVMEEKKTKNVLKKKKLKKRVKKKEEGEAEGEEKKEEGNEEAEVKVVKKKRKLKRRKKKKKEEEEKEKEEEAEDDAVDLEARRAFTSVDLAEAEAQAATAIRSVRKNDLVELAGFAKPPASVKKTLQLISIILGEEEKWESAKKMMRSSDFGKRLVGFDKKSLTAKQLAKLKAILCDESMDVDKVRRCSSAAGTLCLYAHAVCNYAEMAPRVADDGGVAEVKVAVEEVIEEGMSDAVKKSPQQQYSPNPEQVKELKVTKETDAPILAMEKRGLEIDVEEADKLLDEEDHDDLLDFMINS